MTESIYRISDFVADKTITDLQVKVEEIKLSIGNLLSFIIMKEMKRCYGDVWNKMKFMKEPPWTLLECLERIKYYWCSVFKMDLQKQAFKIIEDLIIFLNNNEC